MGLLKIVKHAYDQMTDQCNRKTKAITALIVNLAFVLLHIYKGKNKISEVIES